MWTHWGYKQPPSADLEQGDVLSPNPGLLDLIRLYHPYYAGHAKNEFYIVLTQSCDLVRRAGRCDARYIALAPIRSLRNIVELEFGSAITKVDTSSFSTMRVRGDVERFLARLFNNNEPSYYYLEPENAAGITEPMCAMLALPISFKKEHYDIFLAAKIIGIEDSFQAKLGSSLGQLYSRVGTQDFPQDQVKEKIGRITDTLTAWLDPTDAEALDGIIALHREAYPNAPIDDDTLERLIATIPKKKAVVINLILELAVGANLIASPSPEKFKLRKTLENSAVFAGYFK